MTSRPWELSQISEKARARQDQTLAPARYCGIATSDFNGRND
jgi:hypothetical protein